MNSLILYVVNVFFIILNYVLNVLILNLGVSNNLMQKDEIFPVQIITHYILL